ncbi:MAG: hypothetical protein QOE61_1997 [Micromonosporaceae bacterium]|jgi:hypothetical protein|nr:hypothetical protein [Micromonosporaceae bacterium]
MSTAHTLTLHPTLIDTVPSTHRFNAIELFLALQSKEGLLLILWVLGVGLALVSESVEIFSVGRSPTGPRVLDWRQGVA